MTAARRSLAPLVLLLVALGAGPAAAQVRGQVMIGLGTAHVASPFSSGSLAEAFAGGEVVLKDRVGAAIEWKVASGLGDVMAALCVNGTVHIGSRRLSRRIDPYVTAGYSQLVGLDEGAGRTGLNIGAGVVLSSGDHRAFLLEIRSTQSTRVGMGGLWAFRVGVVFR